MMRRAACKAANPLKIRASLGRKAYGMPLFYGSQSLKDQGKSRTSKIIEAVQHRSQSLKDQGKSRTKTGTICTQPKESQSLKDQGKSRTAGQGVAEPDESQSLKDQGKSRTMK